MLWGYNMDAITLLKEKNRLTYNCKDCDGCRLNKSEFNGCDELMTLHPERYVAIIEQWTKDVPAQTYKDAVLRHFPNANFRTLCINELFGDNTVNSVECESNENCTNCWNKRMEVGYEV